MLVEEFLREDKLEHGTEFFLTTRKTVLKKAASKPQGSFFCFLVRLFNSNMNKDTRLVFIHDLERVNEILPLNSQVKFLSNKVEVA